MSNANDTDPHAEEVDRLVADVLECAGALRRYGDALTRPLGQTEVRWAVMSVLPAAPVRSRRSRADSA